MPRKNQKGGSSETLITEKKEFDLERSIKHVFPISESVSTIPTGSYPRIDLIHEKSLLFFEREKPAMPDTLTFSKPGSRSMKSNLTYLPHLELPSETFSTEQR